MTHQTSDIVLLRVSKARSADFKAFSEGIRLESLTGRTIDDLRQQACADRMALADLFLSAGDRILRSRPPMYRIAVGRYYYSMYHAMRAVSYYRYLGDDYEQHSKLPSNTPQDFKNRAYWENELKDARLKRNQADYDPYPADDGGFRRHALALRTTTRDLAKEARSYLQNKGCNYV